MSPNKLIFSGYSSVSRDEELFTATWVFLEKFQKILAFFLQKVGFLLCRTCCTISAELSESVYTQILIAEVVQQNLLSIC